MERKTDELGSYVEFSHFGDTKEQIIAKLIEHQEQRAEEYEQARDRRDG
jgi:hypothetical protein